jgi:hypothetical protein
MPRTEGRDDDGDAEVAMSIRTLIMSPRPAFTLLLALSASATAAPPADWRARAAAHLDERALDWLQRAPRVHQNFPCAMSCHTTQPYLMARPLLGADAPVLATVRAGIVARVESVRDWKAEAVPF